MVDTREEPTTTRVGSEHQRVPRIDIPELPVAAPVPLAERMLVIDMLRGFAIFGILLVNMAFFNHSFYAQIVGLGPPTGVLDQLARWGIAFFAEGKFYSTFAFLFGLGMAIQYRRFQGAWHLSWAGAQRRPVPIRERSHAEGLVSN